MTESKNVRTAMSVRFGAFEVDLEGRRLLKRGMPITLREESFQVAAALMEQPGEIVTREELRRRLWSSDTFVDFEVALNSAVSRLRGALGDSANSPSFIETIPKRGYRFVVPIPKRPAVAVMPFVNQTGDAKHEYFSDGLTDELIRGLSRVQGLRVTAGSVVFRFKGQRCDARQIGTELGVEAVLEGSLWRTGDRIRISVNLVGVKDGFNLSLFRLEHCRESAWASTPRFSSLTEAGFVSESRDSVNRTNLLLLRTTAVMPQVKAHGTETRMVDRPYAKIRQSGVAFTINIVVHRKNIEHLEEMIASSAHTPHSDSRLEVIPRGEDAAEIVERSRVVHDRDALNLVAKIGQAFSTNH